MPREPVTLLPLSAGGDSEGGSQMILARSDESAATGGRGCTRIAAAASWSACRVKGHGSNQNLSARRPQGVAQGKESRPEAPRDLLTTIMFENNLL